ncbi:MAG: DUF6515 family protein [Acidobacteriota bacterium]
MTRNVQKMTATLFLALLASPQMAEIGAQAEAQSRRAIVERKVDRRADHRVDRRHDRRRNEDRLDERQDRRQDRRQDHRLDRRIDRRIDRRWDRWDDWVDYRRTVAGVRLVAGMIFGSLPPQPAVLIVDGEEFFYAEGVFFQRIPSVVGPTYRVVVAPAGAVVAALPSDAVIVTVAGARYYRSGDIWFLGAPGRYRVVLAP